MASSSFHKINGDYPLTKKDEYLYFLLNRLNNSFPNTYFQREFDVRNYKLDGVESKLGVLDGISTPSRKLCDLFWMSLDWRKIKSLLGGQIRLADVGCGSGEYFEKFNSFSGGEIDQYHGFDLEPRSAWDRISEKFAKAKFSQLNSASVGGALRDQNLVLTQSSVEHFVDDISFFKQLDRHISKNSEAPSLQIHLIPAARSLDLYRLHGVRQYTPRTVAKLLRVINYRFAYMIPLGGEHSFKVHFDWLTKPIMIDGVGDLRKSNLKAFSSEVNSAIIRDNDAGNLLPHFYALIVGSNFSERIQLEHFFQGNYNE